MELVINSPKHGQHVVCYDDCDHDFVKSIKWRLAKNSRNWYVYRSIWKNNKEKKVKMNAYFLDCPDGFIIDHRDGNGLNNCRNNLRLATISQNACNTRMQINNSTGYKGIWPFKEKGRIVGYGAQIVIKGQKIYGGKFETAEQAARRYNELALQYHGEFAKINVFT